MILFLNKLLVVTSVGVHRGLVGEFTVRVASEEGGTDLGQQLLCDQLQTGLQGVGNLKCHVRAALWYACKKNSTAALWECKHK